MTTTTTLADRQRLMRERQAPVQLPEQPGVIVFERHYMPKELAAVWRLDETTIRRLFIDEPGVLKIGKSGRRDGKGTTSRCGFLRASHSVCTGSARND